MCKVEMKGGFKPVKGDDAMDKRTPKFLCRRTGRECCLCLIGHIKRVWECKNLIIREDGDKCTN